MNIEDDFDRFSVALSAVVELLGRGKPVSEAATMLWFQTLARYDIGHVERAFRACISNPDQGQFMPTPADLIRVLDGTRTDRAMIAWGKVYGAMNWPGAYTDVCFDDPVIHVVVEDLGGWPKVCRTESANLSYLEHQFAASYRAYVPKERELIHPRRLTGDRGPDDDYRRANLPVPMPQLIGNKELAKQVYMAGTTDGTRGLQLGSGYLGALAKLAPPQTLTKQAVEAPHA